MIEMHTDIHHALRFVADDYKTDKAMIMKVAKILRERVAAPSRGERMVRLT